MRKIVVAILFGLISCFAIQGPANSQEYNVIEASVVTVTDLNPFVENPNLNFYADFFSGDTIPATTMQSCLNDDCGLNVGALIIMGMDSDCVEGTPADAGENTYCRYLAYCVEADTPINVFGSELAPASFYLDREVWDAAKQAAANAVANPSE